MAVHTRQIQICRSTTPDEPAPGHTKCTNIRTHTHVRTLTYTMSTRIQTTHSERSLNSLPDILETFLCHRLLK